MRSNNIFYEGPVVVQITWGQDCLAVFIGRTYELLKLQKMVCGWSIQQKVLKIHEKGYFLNMS